MANTLPTSTSTKNNALSLVQIICSLLIVNYHTNIFEIPTLEKIAKGGFLMNTVFVFLSGYMLARSFSKNETQTFFDFLLKRVKRIYPAFLITLGLIILFCLYKDIPFLTRDILLWLSGFGYYNTANELFASTHLWFVSVILTCYILFIPTYRLIKKYRIWPVVLIAIVFFTLLFISVKVSKTYSIISNHVGFRFLYHYLVFSIAIYWQASNKKVEQISLLKIAGFVLSVIAYFYFVNSKEFAFMSILSAFLFSVLFVPVIYNTNSFFEKAFKPLYLLAPYTYELYLVHFPVIMALDLYFHGKVIAYILAFLISIPLAILIKKITVAVGFK